MGDKRIKEFSRELGRNERVGGKKFIVDYFTIFFSFFGVPPPSSEINHTHGGLVLVINAWLFSCLLFLNYPVYPLPLGFYLSNFCGSYFSSFSVAGWVADP